MKIQQITNAQKFEGNFIILGNYSAKPNRNLLKIKPLIDNTIQNKNFNLFVKQDYATGKIIFFNPEKKNIKTEIPITSKSSLYIKAAKDFIGSYKQALYNEEQKKWEMEQMQQKKQEIKDIAVTAIFAPLFIIGSILEDISPKLAKKYDRILEKLGL